MKVWVTGDVDEISIFNLKCKKIKTDGRKIQDFFKLLLA